MAKVCCVCNKGTISGHNVSHALNHTKRTWKPNIRRVKATVNGISKRIDVCARCLRSGKVER
ncbi:MAG: 50S ribosomal protein L28 [Bacillota bacterium]|nr:50S ribosomal protein L28 [Bacillota bacterium]